MENPYSGTIKIPVFVNYVADTRKAIILGRKREDLNAFDNGAVIALNDLVKYFADKLDFTAEQRREFLDACGLVGAA